MNQDLTGTNTWLAVIAIVSLLEFVMVCVMGIIGFRLYRRAAALLDRTESAYVAPLTAKVNMVVDQAQDVVRQAQHVEARVRGMVDQVERTASRVGAVAQNVWPVLGAWRAVTAAVHTLRGEHRHTARMSPARVGR